MSLNAFWWAGTGPNTNNSGASDPRVVYDPFANRWVVVTCDEAGSANSRLLVGVSKTPTPDLVSSNWHRAAIDVDPGATLWAKEPTVGFSNQWVVVQVNVYRISDGLLARSHIYVFDKAQMYAGNLLTSYTLLDLDAATYRGTQVPATTYDVGVNDVYLLQMWDCGRRSAAPVQDHGAVPTPTLVPIGYPTQGAWIDSPGDIDFAGQLQGPPGCQYCVPGPCAPRKIRTNDSRIQNVVYRNGKVWATHTVVLSAPTRASVQWWQVRTDATVAQSGLVDDPFGQRSFAFPSIAVNKNDDVLLGYSRFQDDLHAGASYSFRSAIDAPNTMQPESPLKDGEACYYKDFGALPPSNRWGEHSATVVDPSRQPQDVDAPGVRGGLGGVGTGRRPLGNLVGHGGPHAGDRDHGREPARGGRLRHDALDLRRLASDVRPAAAPADVAGGDRQLDDRRRHREDGHGRRLRPRERDGRLRSGGDGEDDPGGREGRPEEGAHRAVLREPRPPGPGKRHPARRPGRGHHLRRRPRSADLDRRRPGGGGHRRGIHDRVFRGDALEPERHDRHGRLQDHDRLGRQPGGLQRDHDHDPLLRSRADAQDHRRHDRA